MKFKIFTLAMLIAGFSATAQRIDFEDVSLEYEQLPQVKVPVGVTTFSTVVATPYAEENKAKQESREKYVANEQASAKAEKEAYDKKQASQPKGIKVLNALSTDKSGVPTGKADIKDDQNYYAKVYSSSTVNAYMNVSGMSKADNAPIIITVTLDGFTVTSLSPKTREISSGTGATATKSNKYSNEVECKHRMTIRIADNNGVVLKEELVPGSETVTKATTQEFNSKSELDKYWSESQSGFLGKLDEQTFSANMASLTKELENVLGRVKKSRTLGVANVSDKKVNYDDYTKAFADAAKGYALLSDKDSKDAAYEALKSALTTWESALKESDLEDKKARVDKKVTEATILNCAEANLWMNNFAAAESHMLQLKIKKLDKWDDRAANLTALIKDQKARYKANQ